MCKSTFKNFLQTHNYHGISIVKILLSVNGLRLYAHFAFKAKYSIKNQIPIYGISYTYFSRIKSVF